MFVSSWSIDDSRPLGGGSVMFAIWAIDIHVPNANCSIHSYRDCVCSLINSWLEFRHMAHDHDNKDRFVDRGIQMIYILDGYNMQQHRPAGNMKCVCKLIADERRGGAWIQHTVDTERSSSIFRCSGWFILNDISLSSPDLFNSAGQSLNHVEQVLFFLRSIWYGNLHVPPLGRWQETEQDRGRFSPVFLGGLSP